MRISDWSSDVCSSDLRRWVPAFAGIRGWRIGIPLSRSHRAKSRCPSVAHAFGVSRLRSTRTEEGSVALHHDPTFATVSGAFGHWPRIAGEYIASTRVGGRVKRPEPVNRTTY